MAELRFSAALATPGALPPVLVIYGNDEAVVDAAAGSILRALRDNTSGASAVAIAASDVLKDPPILLDHFANVGLFDTGGPIHITQATDRLGPLLAQLLETTPDDTADARVILSSASAKARGALVKAALNHASAGVLACYDSSAPPGEIRDMLRDASVVFADPAIETDAVGFLQEMDRTSLQMAVQKLSLLALDGRPIDRSALSESIGHEAAIHSDALASALLTGNRDSLLQEIGTRLRLGEDPAQLTATLGRLISDLNAGLAHLEGRPGGRRLFWKLETPLKEARRQIAGLASKLEQATIYVHETEKRLRSSPISPRADVERLVLRLCGLTARRGGGR